jgi:hypothetical protein
LILLGIVVNRSGLVLRLAGKTEAPLTDATNEFVDDFVTDFLAPPTQTTYEKRVAKQLRKKNR